MNFLFFTVLLELGTLLASPSNQPVPEPSISPEKLMLKKCYHCTIFSYSTSTSYYNNANQKKSISKIYYCQDEIVNCNVETQELKYKNFKFHS